MVVCFWLNGSGQMDLAEDKWWTASRMAPKITIAYPAGVLKM